MSSLNNINNSEITTQSTLAASALAAAGSVKSNVVSTKDQFVQGVSKAETVGQRSAVNDPLFAAQPEPKQPGVFSAVDLFAPGPAYYAAEMAEIMMKSGEELLTANGQIGVNYLNSLEKNIDAFANKDGGVIKDDADIALARGIASIVSGGGLLGFMGYDATFGEGSKLSGELQGLKEQLGTAPVTTLEKADLDPSGLVASQDQEEASLSLGEEGAEPKSTGSLSEEETKELKGKIATKEGEINAQSQRLSMQLNAISQILQGVSSGAEAGIDAFKKAPETAERDIIGGEKQVESQIIETSLKGQSSAAQLAQSALQAAIESARMQAQVSMSISA